MSARGRTGPWSDTSDLAEPQFGDLDALPDETAAAPTALVNGAMLRSATIVSGAFIASRFLGLLREVILARQFGTSGEYDAYVAAFRIPDLLFLVIMAGSFGSAFVPVFAGFLSRGQRQKAWALASSVITMTALTMVAAAVVAFIFAGPLVRYLILPGSAPHYQHISMNVMRILLLSPFLLGLGIAAKGILEAQDRFLFPALAPLLYNVAIILGAIFLAGRYGVYGVAVGVVVGALWHVSVQIPALIRAGLRYRPHIDLHTAGLSEVGRLLLPRVVGQAAFQINFIVVINLASRLSSGHVTALNYAWMLLMLPHGILALSISTVVFPTMARLFEHGQTDELGGTLARAMRPLLFLTLPASVGLFAFRVAIVRALLQHGAFSQESTHLVAPPLAFLALGLTGYALVEILTRAYYAMHDTRTPVATGVGIILLNILLCSLLLHPLGISGLALSLSATTAVEATVLLTVLHHRLGTFDPGFAGWFARVALATAIMALAAFAAAYPLARALDPGTAPLIVRLLLFCYTIGTVALVFVVAAFYLRIPELDHFLARGLRRFPRAQAFIATLR